MGVFDSNAKSSDKPKEPTETVKEEPAIPVDLHVRNATVLKTVADNLTKVASMFVAQVAKEGADPKAVELLEQSKSQLEGIKVT